MHARHAIIHDWTIKFWAMRKLTHKVGKAFCQESMMLETKIKDFFGTVGTFMAMHQICNEDVLNADQLHFEKKLHQDEPLL
ncbi:hypothetical protein ANN_12014 [Periplaneta americana]|uniref:Uncharacterized protein n=1 Tax=Periplaneta americana TaxID=6978 RepID=A0ABQ8T7E4_PERAM|nr:hypothetical protein ANN_12014 [Periplaneta americana]